MENDGSLARALLETRRMAQAGVARQPPADTVAFFVRMQRAMLGWKKDTLASFAGVSTSTIERIERGIAVSPECLERVAAALKQPPGAFTEPRVPFTAEVAEKLAEAAAPFDDTVSVPVRPLRGHRQVAELANAHLYLLDAGRISGEVDGEMAALHEWLDLVSFVLTAEDGDGFVTTNNDTPTPRRKLYDGVLACVHEIESRAYAVALAGTYEAETGLPEMPKATVALVAFFPKLFDPAAPKRQMLFAPACVALAWPPD